MKRPCAKTNTFLVNLLFSNLHTFIYGIYKEDKDNTTRVILLEP